MLLACRGGTLVLASLSLTVPMGYDVRGPAATLAAWVGGRPGEGVLLAVDRAPTGAEHVHGLALVRDAGMLTERWGDVSGAEAEGCKASTLTGWGPHLRGPGGNLLPNVAAVLRYAFKPWPVQYGQRSLDADVLASGVFAQPWDETRAALAAGNGTADANPIARPCKGCCGPIPLHKKRSAETCSTACRVAAYRAVRRER